MIQGIVDAVTDRNHVQVRVTAAVGDDAPKPGDTIERSRDLFVGYGCKRADEQERAARQQVDAMSKDQDRS